MNKYTKLMSIFLLSISSYLHATNINHLLGTFTILPNDLKDLSLIHGAIAWHGEIIRNIYDYTALMPNEPIIITTQEEFLAQKHLWLASLPSPICQIARDIFYRIPGSFDIADFKVSDSITKRFYNHREQFIQIAAKILAITHIVALHNNYQDRAIHRLIELNALATGINAVPGLEKTIALLQSNKEDPLWQHDTLQALKMLWLATLWAFIGDDKKLIERYYQTIEQELTLTYALVDYEHETIPLYKKNQQLEQDIHLLSSDESAMTNTIHQQTVELQNNIKKLALIQDDKNKNFAVARKYKKIQNEDLYQVFHSLFLDSKKEEEEISKKISDLKKSLTTFNTNIKQIAKKRQKNQNEYNLNLKELHQITQQRGRLIQPLPQDNFVIESIINLPKEELQMMPYDPTTFAETYEKAVFLALLPGERPNDLVTRWSTPRGGKEQIGDCVESLLRSLINHLVYDANKLYFRPELLAFFLQDQQQNNIPHSLSPALIDFYTKYPTPQVAASFQAHTDWAHIINNKPFIVYHKKRSGGTENFFMRLDHSVSNEFKDSMRKKYHDIIFIEHDATDDFLFELSSSPANIVILLNDLLNLQFFDSSEHLAHELMRPDFASHYFNKFFGQFGEYKNFALYTHQTSDSIHMKVTFSAIDNLEKVSKLFGFHLVPIHLFNFYKKHFHMHRAPYEIRLRFSLYHGDIKSEPLPQSDFPFLQQALSNNKITLQDLPYSFPLLFTHKQQALFPKEMGLFCLLNQPIRFFNTIFMQHEIHDMRQLYVIAWNLKNHLPTIQIVPFYQRLQQHFIGFSEQNRSFKPHALLTFSSLLTLSPETQKQKYSPIPSLVTLLELEDQNAYEIITSFLLSDNKEKIQELTTLLIQKLINKDATKYAPFINFLYQYATQLAKPYEQKHAPLLGLLYFIALTNSTSTIDITHINNLQITLPIQSHMITWCLINTPKNILPFLYQNGYNDILRLLTLYYQTDGDTPAFRALFEQMCATIPDEQSTHFGEQIKTLKLEPIALDIFQTSPLPLRSGVCFALLHTNTSTLFKIDVIRNIALRITKNTLIGKEKIIDIIRYLLDDIQLVSDHKKDTQSILNVIINVLLSQKTTDSKLKKELFILALQFVKTMWNDVMQNGNIDFWLLPASQSFEYALNRRTASKAYQQSIWFTIEQLLLKSAGQSLFLTMLQDIQHTQPPCDTKQKTIFFENFIVHVCMVLESLQKNYDTKKYLNFLHQVLSILLESLFTLQESDERNIAEDSISNIFITLTTSQNFPLEYFDVIETFVKHVWQRDYENINEKIIDIIDYSLDLDKLYDLIEFMVHQDPHEKKPDAHKKMMSIIANLIETKIENDQGNRAFLQKILTTIKNTYDTL